MSYGLILDPAVSEAVASLDEIRHDLFVLALLDLPDDPYGQGTVHRRSGPVTTMSRPLGGMGLVVYDVDEETSTITVTEIILL